MKLLRVMGNVSPGFQVYLESQPAERQKEILSGVKKFDREQRETDLGLQSSFDESFSGYEDAPVGGFH